MARRLRPRRGSSGGSSRRRTATRGSGFHSSSGDGRWLAGFSAGGATRRDQEEEDERGGRRTASARGDVLRRLGATNCGGGGSASGGWRGLDWTRAGIGESWSWRGDCLGFHRGHPRPKSHSRAPGIKYREEPNEPERVRTYRQPVFTGVKRTYRDRMVGIRSWRSIRRTKMPKPWESSIPSHHLYL
jgi:hypothetical protein